MKVISIITAVLLPLAVIGSPLNAVEVRNAEVSVEEANILKKEASVQARDAAAESVGLVKRDKNCDIVNVVTTVDCWWLPKHGGNGNHQVTSFPGTRNDIPFYCWTKCERVGDITTWFWTSTYGCYVPGYYLDNNCVSTGSGALPQCPWAAADRGFGGCAA